MSDFFEGTRSSGVVGTGLVVVLLFGFGALFLAVFDDRLNGENASRLKGMIHEQGAEIYALEAEIERAEATLVNQKRFEVILEELEKESKVLEVLTQKESALAKQIEEEKEMILKIEEDKIAYREEYREFARKDAIGETFDEIILANGKVLKNARIREIHADKVRFTTEYGTASVTWEEFADDMRDRFQIGDGELEAHQAKLEAIQAKRSQLVAEGRGERAIYLREMELKKSLSQVERSLRDKSGKISKAEFEVAALRAKEKSYRAKYDAAVQRASSSSLDSLYYSSYSTSNSRGKGYLNAATKAAREASVLSTKISIAKEQIRKLEQEKRKLEIELEKVKAKR